MAHLQQSWSSDGDLVISLVGYDVQAIVAATETEWVIVVSDLDGNIAKVEKRATFDEAEQRAQQLLVGDEWLEPWIKNCQHHLLTLEERIWQKVLKGTHDNDCDLWMASCKKYSSGNEGPGRISVNTAPRVNKWMSVPRVVYELEHGPIPENAKVRHLCGHVRCINLLHLWLDES